MSVRCPIATWTKERYTQGLLAFYELNRPEILARAYADAYERGVDRYAAIVEQGREVHPLEIQYFRELKQCVADYIRELADGKEAGHPAAFGRIAFISTGSARNRLIQHEHLPSPGHFDAPLSCTRTSAALRRPTDYAGRGRVIWKHRGSMSRTPLPGT